jgi:hypothetical protein
MRSEVWLGLIGPDGQELSLATCIGYKRVKVALVDGRSEGEIDFPQAGSDWGEAVRIGIYSDATTPRMLGSSGLNPGLNISAATTLRMESMTVDIDSTAPALAGHVFGEDFRGDVGLYIDMEPGQRAELTEKIARARQALGKVGGKE